MRKNVWLSIVLVNILLSMIFTASCAEKIVQTNTAPTTQPEVSKESEKSYKEVDQDIQPQEDPLLTESVAREETETVFVNEGVQFAFDSALLSDQAQRILTGNADYLRAHSEVMVTIEGHCDERGTNTYNLALGERRAESVKYFFVEQGISANRLNTISYGEERPIALGQNEASWAKNRRAQFEIN